MVWVCNSSSWTCLAFVAALLRLLLFAARQAVISHAAHAAPGTNEENFVLQLNITSYSHGTNRLVVELSLVERS